MIINRIRFSGKVTDRWDKNLEGATVVFTDSNGKPVKHEDKSISVVTDSNGEYAIRIPSVLIEPSGSGFEHEIITPHLTAKMSGFPAKKSMIKNDRDTEHDFILGSTTQEFEEVVLDPPTPPCKTTACKIKNSFARNKKAYIWGLVALILTAVTLTLIFGVKKRA
jgi:hypothetical protein